MQTYLFIGGNQDGINIPIAPDQDAVQLPAGVTGKETYIRDTLAVGDVSVTIYRHESLTPEQVLDGCRSDQSLLDDGRVVELSHSASPLDSAEATRASFADAQSSY